MGLTLYGAVVPDPDAHRRASLAGVGWLTAGVMAALVLHWPHDALRLAHSDVDLLVLSTTGAAFGVATGAAGRRLLRAGMSERPSDAGG